MNTPEQSGIAVSGWYGKLPSLGDFASRRLPPTFIEPWDAWLSQVLDASRRRLGNDWLNAYLSCPVWRFVLAPGALSPQCGWAGVMMASLDRVGRHFPLTVVAPVSALPATPAALAGLWGWLSRIERDALDAIEFDHDIDGFDGALERAGLPPETSDPGPWAGRLAGCSLWVSVDRDPRLPFDFHTASGMPDCGEFAVMLTGR